MNLVLAAGVVIGAVTIAIVVMLLVRRRAPAGGHFNDGDRAAGVFGVMATGFSVLLGFIIFLAFSSYDASRSGAANEATIVAHQVEAAQFFPDDTRGEITGQLICYARSVAGDEWTHLQDGSLRGTINPWTAAMLRTMQDVEPGSPSEQSAYDRLMDETADREDARNDRVHSVGGVV